MPLAPSLLAIATSAAVLAIPAPTSFASAGCGGLGYAYAGFVADGPADRVAASIRPLIEPEVRSGHVAAWVGIGGMGVGPRGEDAWLQTGISAFPDGRRELYVEIKLPRRDASYLRLGRSGSGTHRFGVIEVRPNTWRAWLDGRPVTGPVVLPGSHGTWKPVVVAETRTESSRCNRYAFRFDRILRTVDGRAVVLAGGQALVDPGQRLDRRDPWAFVARSR